MLYAVFGVITIIDCKPQESLLLQHTDTHND